MAKGASFSCTFFNLRVLEQTAKKSIDFNRTWTEPNSKKGMQIELQCWHDRLRSVTQQKKKGIDWTVCPLGCPNFTPYSPPLFTYCNEHCPQKSALDHHHFSNVTMSAPPAFVYVIWCQFYCCWCGRWGEEGKKKEEQTLIFIPTLFDCTFSKVETWKADPFWTWLAINANKIVMITLPTTHHHHQKTEALANGVSCLI